GRRHEDRRVAGPEGADQPGEHLVDGERLSHHGPPLPIPRSAVILPGEKNMGTVRNMPSEPGDFSVALSILRISRGWSQDQAARAAGVTNSALSEYERGKKMP